MIDQAIVKARDFVGRQKRNYRVGVARASANSFLTGLTSQYSAIYTVGLGADSVQLGAISSVGSALSALVSTPVGWLVDRYGIRQFYLLAIALMAGGSLFRATAHDWRFLVVATMLASIAMRLSGTGCRVISADSVQNQDRVTAQNVCGSLASVAGMLSPLLAAYLVTHFGGMTVEGIRPLYYIQVVGYVLVLLVVALQLREPQRERLEDAKAKVNFIADFRFLFKRRRRLGRWIAISALTSLPLAMY